MGGYGSGRWRWHTARNTVDESQSFSARRLLRGVQVGEFRSGQLSWSRSGRTTGAIGYRVDTLTPGNAGLWLVYDVHNTHSGERTSYDYRVPIESTPCRFGGHRWWFRCPQCERRVLTLHLAPGATRFACRTCHDLTYTSCQESHKFDRFYASLAQEMARTYPGITPRDVRDVLERAFE